jgi:acyl-CoA synthetase (AMP-forming)/AMP-acid ligase II
MTVDELDVELHFLKEGVVLMQTSVAVIGAAAKWGETVAAIVVPRAGSQPTTEAIVAHGVPPVASYKKPRHLVFVDALPPLQSGKADKIGLRKQIAKAANEKQGEVS